MPPAIEAHFFAANDLNGDTIFECSTDDQFVKSIKLDIQRDKLGSGLVNFSRRVPLGLFSNDILRPEVFVRYLIPEVHATKYLWGNFLDVRQQKVISKAEKGGEGFSFGGPGPKFYLHRMLLWSATFTDFGNPVERESGIWTWPSTARAGAILNRLILEDQANPSGPFLPDLTKSFSDNDDSNNVAWADDIAGNEDFTLRIQDDYLKILWQLEDAADLITEIDLGEVGDPLMQLNAYQTRGRDLTGDIAVDTVHFTEGVNIATDLDVEGASLLKGSHALVKGNDGVYELAVRPSWDPGEYKKVIGTFYDSAQNAVLDRAGVRFLQRQENAERQIVLRIVPGFSPADGLYFPGPESTDGHLWLSDVVNLSTGGGSPTELDYTDEECTVTGIEIETLEAVKSGTALEVARSFEVTVHLNEERKGSNSTPNRNTRGLSGGGTTVKFCRTVDIGESVAGTRLYFSNDAGVGSETDDPDWSVATSPELNLQLRTTPGGSASTHANDSVNLPVGYYIDAQYSMTLAAGDLLEALKVGGPFKMQMRGNSRNGIGIDEGAQNNRLTISVRIIRAGVVIGTAVGVGDVVASSTYPAISTLTNRGIAGTFAAVPSAQSGDKLVVEVGWHHLGPASGGTGCAFQVQPTVGAGSDLPEDSSTTSDLRAWIEFAGFVGPSGSGLHPDIAGTSTRAQRCDHTEHVFRDSDPTVDDDEVYGYPIGTLWLNTTTEQGFLLEDNAEGAAVWTTVFGPGTLALDDLTDVDTSTTPPTDGQALVWDDTNDIWVPGDVEAGGGGSGAGTVGVRVYNNADLTPGASPYTVLFNSELRDDAGFHSTSSNTGRLTVPAGMGGWYGIAGHINYPANPTSTSRLDIRKNGTTAIASMGAGPDAGGRRISVSAFAYLAAGDYVELVLTNSALDTIDFDAEASPVFGMVFLAGSAGELDYVQVTADVTISGTTEGAATTIITGTSQAYAAVPTMIDVFIPRLDFGAHASGNTLILLLYDGATLIGRIGVIAYPANGAFIVPFRASYRLTPTAATHQYIVKAFRTNANVIAELGSGGSGEQLPAFIRVSRA